VECLVFGGYFFAAAPVIPANLLFVFGWVALLQRRRKAAMALGASALVVGIAGALPALLILMYLRYPAYYAWLASFAVLTAGGYYLPQSEPARPAPERPGGAFQHGQQARVMADIGQWGRPRASPKMPAHRVTSAAGREHTRSSSWGVQARTFRPLNPGNRYRPRFCSRATCRCRSRSSGA
jgi:hypothetical protein